MAAVEWAVGTLQKVQGLANYRSVSLLSWKWEIATLDIYTREDSGDSWKLLPLEIILAAYTISVR